MPATRLWGGWRSAGWEAKGRRLAGTPDSLSSGQLCSPTLSLTHTPSRTDGGGAGGEGPGKARVLSGRGRELLGAHHGVSPPLSPPTNTPHGASSSIPSACWVRPHRHCGQR